MNDGRLKSYGGRPDHLKVAVEIPALHSVGQILVWDSLNLVW